MNSTLFRPLIVPAKTVVLLVFVPNSGSQQDSVNQLLDRIGAVLGDRIRITRVDQVVHPEVVRSFGVHQLPSFILLKQGIEIWRHNGLMDARELIRTLSVQLKEDGKE
ncbi:thioredoxin family protein [Larkinella punicea]|uniref:Thioredoxin n=1 Tax=Larkinella punicea TaxID=2315727 RepID=A0A368JH16_9BACT|nr:thioredoxin family protein [Larkinella punicea]RCR66356.1 thioredoxin [Larkinella punicea]